MVYYLLTSTNIEDIRYVLDDTFDDWQDAMYELLKEDLEPMKVKHGQLRFSAFDYKNKNGMEFILEVDREIDPDDYNDVAEKYLNKVNEFLEDLIINTLPDGDCTFMNNEFYIPWQGTTPKGILHFRIVNTEDFCWVL